MRIRDISSSGASFYDSASWNVGDGISLAVRVGDGIVGPFSYALKTRGNIVRKEGDGRRGPFVFAVSFEEGVRMLDWMEIKEKAKETGV